MSKIFASVCIYDRPEAMFDITFEAARNNSQHKVVVYHEIGCSSLVLVRNRHVARFLTDPKYRDCEYFCSLDSDLVLHNNGGGDNNLFDMLVADNVDFTGGIYSLKTGNPSLGWQCASVPKNMEKVQYRTGLVEMDWLSGGCWLVKREAVQRMWDHYHDELVAETIDFNEMVCLWLPYIHTMKDGSRKMLTEDWAFNQRWLDIGGRIWCNSAVRLSHIGRFDYNLWRDEEHLGGHFNTCHIDSGALKYLVKRYEIKTMYELGCGLGGIAPQARWFGVDWMGIEGLPTATISRPVIVHDYTRGKLPVECGERDLALSVEFMEHVADCYWENVVDTLRRCKVVCFTHSPPGHMGHHHVNCRGPEVWIKRMESAGFVLDELATQGVRAESTMKREFMRDTGLVFVRQT